MKHLFFILLLSCCIGCWAAQEITIIPKPLRLTVEQGKFLLRPQTVISYEKELYPQAAYLQEVIGGSTGWDLKLQEGTAEGSAIHLETADKIRCAEGYELTVQPSGVRITGADAGGVFYGIQTLLQLFPSEIYSPLRQKNIVWEAPSVSVYDAPSHPWRGMMLDVARYFFDKDFVKKYIDMMAMYKMNKFQFHLIDDSGWRLEIKKYPKLTEVGAWAGKDQNRLGGYYTQEDIKEIIEYAKVRNVEVIPEIEFPAHMLSAVAAYPWLSCKGEPREVPTQHFISRDLICVGKESSFRFLQDVLDEMVALFPSHYINIGGDEAVYDNWEKCPKCQAVMKENGLKEASQLQGYLTNRVLQMMKAKERTVIGWEEIIKRGDLDGQVVALIWHNEKDTVMAVEKNHLAILTPATHAYLDFPEGKTPGEVKAATWMPPISIEKSYSLAAKDYSEGSHVLGVQGCMWSDQFIHGTILQEIVPINENRSENYVEYFTFPRMLALSEVGWTKEANRDYGDFAHRLTYHYARLDRKGCNYRVPEPFIASMKETPEGVTFTLSESVKGASIRYTTDGSYPTIHSPLYTSPVTVDTKNNFHAITVVSNRHYSLPIHFAYNYEDYKQYGEFAAEWKPALVSAEKPAPWKVDVTGKVSGNGTYEVTFVQTEGNHGLAVSGINVFKRDERLVHIAQTQTVKKSQVAAFRFKIDSFEAGTPFYLDVQMAGVGGTNTNGAVFIRKISEE
ncbi:beta-N-acetylhexosaminidase [Phocaeicola faecium]|uniref:beta-N-acetylhexosaminidase n=1 Tax=Phocaeicola faecium TaxID=2762213 RepID=A0ABR8V7B6_9BACT|nr:family 20 glycosylhydrolase [Phocaeicola faecium]MBD8000663.1 family 20 glycosylhydrolase [Phocaeicola faecium]